MESKLSNLDLQRDFQFPRFREALAYRAATKNRLIQRRRCIHSTAIQLSRANLYAMTISRVLAQSNPLPRKPLLTKFPSAVRRTLATPANSAIRPTQTTTLSNGLSVATEYSPYL